MNIFHKSKEEIPKLPELPNLPDFPSINDIMQARESSLPPIIPSIPTNNSEKRTIELPEINYSKQAPQFPLANSTDRFPISKEPLFIKIDKFQEAINRFSEIKEKIGEIDSSIRKIKEIKEREEQEIREWEAEIQQVKEKIANIDSSLFNKI